LTPRLSVFSRPPFSFPFNFKPDFTALVLVSALFLSHLSLKSLLYFFVEFVLRVLSPPPVVARDGVCTVSSTKIRFPYVNLEGACFFISPRDPGGASSFLFFSLPLIFRSSPPGSRVSSRAQSPKRTRADRPIPHHRRSKLATVLAYAREGCFIFRPSGVECTFPLFGRRYLFSRPYTDRGPALSPPFPRHLCLLDPHAQVPFVPNNELLDSRACPSRLHFRRFMGNVILDAPIPLQFATLELTQGSLRLASITVPPPRIGSDTEKNLRLPDFSRMLLFSSHQVENIDPSPFLLQRHTAGLRPRARRRLPPSGVVQDFWHLRL